MLKDLKDSKSFHDFKGFLMRGDVIVIAIGLVIALAFSTLVQAFTTYLINPLVAAVQGNQSIGLGVQLGATGNRNTFMDFGSFIAAVLYFVILVAAVYFFVVLPYKTIQAQRGVNVFGDPAPTKTCPACLSEDLPVAATKCRHCATDQPPAPTTPPP